MEADLIDTLARESRKLLDLTTGDDTVTAPEQAVRDAAELWRVVARLVKGRTPLEVSQAFGAPGDWGYGTPIGAALKRYYDAANRAVKGDTGPAPLDVVLPCPRCGLVHVDAPEPATGWTNPPHKSHLCHGCGLVWRPADVPTNGVAAAKTRGEKDTPADAGRIAAVEARARRVLRDMEALAGLVGQLTDAEDELVRAVIDPLLVETEPRLRALAPKQYER